VALAGFPGLEYARRVRALLLSAWALFIVVTLFLGPSALPSDLLDMSRRLTLFDWPEPVLTGLWYATGVLLFLHATYYLSERPQHAPHPLPVLILSPLFGSLLLLPYYALRRPAPARQPWPWPWKLLRYVLIAELVGFLLFGIIAGDLATLWREIAQRRFSYFLFVDFLTLAALLAPVVGGKLSAPGSHI
jgi:hypothetical protein